ncbi:uncharacterized protein LOC118150274 isoform X3 [Callithrix jacchus]|uniref:uncharacterized protein LOC118150274 isoform X3 n=1 Tax=Callithrix jacchus TaxID=9483 RepID=UPI00159E6169|nr:uncharacterized protein LOC118150274 isoform X3 [Callithrix jacchus]
MGLWRVSDVESSPGASAAGKSTIPAGVTGTRAPSVPFPASAPDSWAPALQLSRNREGASFPVVLFWMHLKYVPYPGVKLDRSVVLGPTLSVSPEKHGGNADSQAAPRTLGARPNSLYLTSPSGLWSLLESAVPVVPSGSFLEACLSEPRATQVGHLIDFHISTQKRKNGKWDFVKHRYDKWSRFPRLTQVLEVPCGCGCGGMATRKLWILRKSGKETLTIQQFRENLP